MHILRTLLRVSFAVLLVLLPSTPGEVYADDGRSSQGPLRMVYVEFPPYSFTDQMGQAQGLAIDLARSLGSELGREMTFRSVLNPAEQLESLAAGEADMTSLLARNEQRLAQYAATQPLGSFGVGAFVLDAHTAQTPEDLSGMRIGVVKGSIGVKAAAQIPFSEVVELSTNTALIVPLLAGEVDAVVTSSDAFLARLREIRVDRDVRLVSSLLVEMPYGFYVSQENTALLSALDAAIDRTVTQRDLDVLNGMWFGTPTMDARAKLIFWGVLALFCVGAVALVALVRLRQQSTNTRRLLADRRANQLLLDALNGVDAAIAIYDEEFRAILWNEGFARSYPDLCDVHASEPLLRDAILVPGGDPKTEATQRRIDADIYASEVIRKLRQGHTVTRIAPTGDGKVFEASEFPVGEDRYASVRVDVTRLFDQAAEIDRQRLQLEQVNERLQLFAAMAAHDLRSPLLQQGALLDFLAEDIGDAMGKVPTEIEDQMTIIKGLSGKMQSLISELLEYSKAGQSSGPLEQIDPNGRVAGIIELAGISDDFTVTVEGTLPFLHADPTAFDLVMRNLISNAAKHHDRPSGKITLRGERLAGSIMLEIEDDGPGIPKAYHKTIFEPFKRLSAHVDGTGLGLSFIRQTVEGWGGTIDVQSDGERGSRFKILLPVKERDDIEKAA